MPSSLSPVNRRRIGRPADGDERPCGLCGGTMWFDEQHVSVTRHASARRPAWRCRCGQEVFVRERRTGAALRADLLELRRALAEVRARAREQRARAVTLRQRASESLARAQRLAIGVIAFDQHARLLSANVAACALSGYSQPELRRMTLRRLAEGCEEAQKPWRQFQRDGHLEGRYRLRRKTGEVIFVECVVDANVLPGIHVGALATRRLLRAFVVQPNA